MTSIIFKVIGLTRLGLQNARSRFGPVTFGFPGFPEWEADALTHLAIKSGGHRVPEVTGRFPAACYSAGPVRVHLPGRVLRRRAPVSAGVRCTERRAAQETALPGVLPPSQRDGHEAREGNGVYTSKYIMCIQ